jgi:hypothetical protein
MKRPAFYLSGSGIAQILHNPLHFGTPLAVMGFHGNTYRTTDLNNASKEFALPDSVDIS